MEGRHYGEPLGLCSLFRGVAGLIIVFSGDHDLRPKGGHGSVFLNGIAFRDKDFGLQAKGSCCFCLALAVIATGCGTNPANVGLGAFQPVHIGNATAYFEGANGRVILVFYPDLKAQFLVQKRPAVLRRWRHLLVNQRCRRLYLFSAKERHLFRLSDICC